MVGHGGMLGEAAHEALELRVHVVDGQLPADDVGHRRVREVFDGHERISSETDLHVP
jgi:hypothetical protein